MGKRGSTKEAAVSGNKSKKARAEEARSLATDLTAVRRLINVHLDEFPTKVMRTYIHMLNLSTKEPVVATTRLSDFNLHELLSGTDWDDTYHVHSKIPEYFLMAWMRSVDDRLDGQEFVALKHIDKRWIRKALDRVCGIKPNDPVTKHLKVKVVMARFYTQLHQMAGEEMGKIVDESAEGKCFDAMPVWEWADAAMGKVTHCLFKGFRFLLPPMVTVLEGTVIVEPWSIRCACVKGLGGFNLLEAALMSEGDIVAKVTPWTDESLRTLASALHKEYMTALGKTKDGSITEVAALSSVATPARMRECIQAYRKEMSAPPTPLGHMAVPLGNGSHEELDDASDAEAVRPLEPAAFLAPHAPPPRASALAPPPPSGPPARQMQVRPVVGLAGMPGVRDVYTSSEEDEEEEEPRPAPSRNRGASLPGMRLASYSSASLEPTVVIE